VALLLAAWTAPALAQAPATNELRLARYTTTDAQPEPQRAQPLAVVATVHFPRATVATVGEALRHLLVRTGYALREDEQLEASARHLLTLPLPESHRVLGPYRVEAMVQVLLGESWNLQIDHLQRQLGFSAAVAAVPTTPPTSAPAAATPPGMPTAALAPRLAAAQTHPQTPNSTDKP